MRFNKKTVIAGVAVLAAAGGGILVSSSADAATTGPSAGQGSVTGWQIKDGTIYAADINPDVVKWFTGTYDNTVTTKSVKDGALGEVDFDAATKAKLNAVGTGGAGPAGPAGAKGEPGDPASDVFGKQGGSLTIAPKAIAAIGGSWVAGKTDLGSFTLPAGTWLINSAVTFDRKDANDAAYANPHTDTMPQFALRFNITDTNTFGDDAGTIMGSPISRAGYTELTGSSTKAITLTETTTITAYGFGYNEDRSNFGGGQITAGGQVTAVKIG